MTIGTAEVSEWMGRIFPHERELRLARLQEVREGQPIHEFAAVEAEEAPSSERTLPSVSALVSPSMAVSLRVGVSLDDFARLAARAGAACTPEIAGLIAMDVCDALHERPSIVDTEQIRLTDDGHVTLTSPLDSARASDSARSILGALRKLPIAQGAVSEMLHAAEYRSPDELNAALQTAIEPLARGRARQQLVRLLLSRHVSEAPPPKREPDPSTREPTRKITRPSAPPAANLPDDDELARSMRGRGARSFLLVLAALILGGGVLYGTQPDLVREWLGLQTSPPAAPAPAVVVRPEPSVGEVVVRVATPGAHVLRFVGRSPVSVPDVPRGVGQDVLAMLAGHADTWGAVPADAVWSSDVPPLYELALQLPELTEADAISGTTLDATLDAGAALDMSGTLRVITTPPGAKVFRVIGAAPEVHLGNVPTDAVLELLIVADGFETQRELVTPAQWDGNEAHLVEVAVELRARPERPVHHRRAQPAAE